ncbi:MoaA/NifB/PqqE/SkfB family radical SAM enzyme [Desulfobotulus alkaliphilus]|uniref:MoaA/NifB/PqqE/SkfB family radical SAM enzyme n=1 Tax=Desulfobotulus alkaliphilus TaxID=622671 RepID=A0A562RGG9_9BACT|nr:radical SAM protein [Desulfobotulus alkaliphilus]TWI68189.1 MoaA/NifB/PqqE/SkfB family radical SAM enzyme [Desulfobotulus alkaliphilus]
MASDYMKTESLGSSASWPGKNSLLPHLDMELTERCNNRCIHCYINQPENDAQLKVRELSTDEIKAIVKDAAGLGCMSIRFTGGEPLLREDFSEIYLFTRRQGIRVTLFTNATLMDEALTDLFVKYPPGSPVEVTLYGMTSDSYEAISLVKGSFAKAMAGIGLLRKKGIPFYVKSIYFKGREADKEAFADFVEKDLSADTPPAFSMNFDLRARRDMPAKVDFIKSLRVSPEESVVALEKYKDAYIKDSRRFARKFMGPAGDRLFNCGCGKGGSVDAYGFFQPCLLLRHPESVYDLKKGSFKQALQVFFPELREKISTNGKYLQRCAGCFLHGFCDQCPAKSWMEHGLLDEPVEYCCELAHAKARFLGLLGDKERAWEVKDWKVRLDRFVTHG